MGEENSATGDIDIDAWIRGSSARPASEADFQPRHVRKSMWGWLTSLFRTSDMTPEDIFLDGARFDHQLKKLFAWLIILVILGQIILANVLLVVYLLGWFDPEADSKVIIAWLSAGVVEVIGLMAIITTYLFPGERRGDKRKRSK